MRTKEEAEQMGRVMLNQLGEGWKITIDENIGWYVKASKGPLYVSAHKFKDKVYYNCLMTANPNESGWGECYWTGNESFSDARDAVRDQVERAKRFTDKLNRAVLRAGMIGCELPPKTTCNKCGAKL